MTDDHTPGRRYVTMIGLGRLGSVSAFLIGRLPEVTSITLIDPDRYDEQHRRSQDIARRDVGVFKTLVTARRLRAIRDDLTIERIDRPVESVPPGRVGRGLIVTAVDSRRARCHVNRIAHRLGVPWVDAGVERDGLLVRVSVFVPGTTTACYQCGLTDADDGAGHGEQPPCRSGMAAADTPAGLAATAAGIQSLEAGRLLRGEASGLAGRQLMMSLEGHAHELTRLAADPACRCEHEPWTIQPLDVTPDDITLGTALELCGRGPAALSVPGKSFVTAAGCGDCGPVHTMLRLEDRYTRAQRACPNCPLPTRATGRRLPRLDASSTTPRQRQRRLRQLGFLPGDVFTIERTGERRHFELVGGLPALRSHPVETAGAR